MMLARCMPPFVASLLFIALPLAGPLEGRAQGSTTVADSGRIERSTVIKAATFTSAYYGASWFVLGRTWYEDRAVVPFHFYNDNRAWLQVDKLGHAFGSYVYSYTGYRYLLGTGLNRTEALLFGGTLGLVL